MSAFGIREAMNSILSGCSGSLSVAVHAQESHSSSKKLHGGHDTLSSSKTSNATDTNTSSSSSSETIVVAVDASRSIVEYALRWAVGNVVQPGDCLAVLAMCPKNHHSGWKAWGFPKLAGECAIVGECNGASSRLSKYGSRSDPEEGIKESCTRLAQKLCGTKKVHVKVKVISTTTTKGAVALEAKKLHATWVVLDRHLKKEGKCCMEGGSSCNVVLVSQLGFRILCLNLKQAPAGSRGLLPFEEEASVSSSSAMLGLPLGELEQQERKKKVIFCPAAAAAAAAKNQGTGTMHFRSSQEGESSSPEIETPFTATERGSSTSSSSEQDTLSCLMEDPGGNHVSGSTLRMLKDRHLESGTAAAAAAVAVAARCEGTSSSDLYVKGPSFYPDSSSKTTYERRNCLDEQLITQTKSLLSDAEQYMKISQDEHSTTITPQDISEHFSALQVEGRKLTHRKSRPSHRSSDNLVPIQESVPVIDVSSSKQQHIRDHLDRTSSVRKAMSLPLKRSPAGSPPLCSICQHASPVFGRPPKRFSYSELQFATGGFCKANFLAEGGYGSVHRGVLQDGIPVAVKQYKLASSQGDMEFCSEVEVLSCAQHRNVVMLIGYCIEKNRRLLVYEFICNGSLDSHLYGQDRPALKWSPRHKIAVGAARGLRYLHEECRVGCIVHRDMRPNNILLTHDFEPMVGDFGLARWQPDGDLGVETRVIGTFGYLAPEYAQTGQITEKADVYSFGVVLLELVTGRKAIDISRPKGQQCLTEWARPLLEEQAHHEMIDPRLENEFNQYEAFCMLYAASLCTQRDPHLRPRMSQVLRMLEGDLTISRNSSPMRSSSGRLSYSPHSNTTSGRSVSPSGRTSQLPSFSEKLDSLSQTVSSYMSAHPIVGCNTRLSHEALRAAYRDKIVMDSGRNSLEEHSPLQHAR